MDTKMYHEYFPMRNRYSSCRKISNWNTLAWSAVQIEFCHMAYDPQILRGNFLPFCKFYKMVDKCEISRTPQVCSKVRYQKPNQIASALHSFSTTFSYTWAGNASVYSMKSMFWTNKKLSLMVAWSSSVSISCFKVQSSIGHLVWFFDSGNSILSGANLWCPHISRTGNCRRTKFKWMSATKLTQKIGRLMHITFHCPGPTG